MNTAAIWRNNRHVAAIIFTIRTFSYYIQAMLIPVACIENGLSV